MRRRMIGLISVLSLLGATAREAAACGCFAPPNPQQPVLQAGERLLFAVKDNQVTMHVQIQYQGSASEFGWIVPLPSLPTLEVGTDEVFNELVRRTNPSFSLERTFEPNCRGGSIFGCASNARFAAAGGDLGEQTNGGGGTKPTPLVIQDSVGPYDFAVLKADDKQAMLDWLAMNRYFVPGGTDTVLGPYIRPGAYFLALKLRSGKSTGDLQPVVVRYASDLPMIPIILTSVTSVRNLGIQAWVLGQGRALPRNYHHVVINQAALDWINGANNYADVVLRAIGEAPKKHAFITEYAGSTQLMHDVLDSPGRFGSTEVLSRLTDALEFIAYLKNNYKVPYPFTGVVRSILAARLEKPAGVNATAEEWGAKPDFYITSWLSGNPGGMIKFDPAATANELDTRVAKPALAAGKLFREFPKMTRLFTALSPEDMTADPVFGTNPDLPDVPLVQNVKSHTECDQSVIVTTGDGFDIFIPANARGEGPPAVPAALRIETLRDQGAPEVLTDNASLIKNVLGTGGCRVPAKTPRAAPTWLLWGLALFLGVRARRRR